MVHGYDVGTRAWQPDQTEGWVASEVKSKKINGDKVVLVFKLDNGEVWLRSNLNVNAVADHAIRIDQNCRDNGGRTPVRWPQPSTANEPNDAGSQR